MTQTVQRILAIVLTGGLLLLTLELVRRKRLMERYALLWLFSTAVLIVLAAWKGLLTTISHAVGVHYPPALLFAVAFGFELLLLLRFSVTISRLSDQNKVLAQRSALLEERVRRLENATPQPPLQGSVSDRPLAGADAKQAQETARAWARS